MSTRDQSFGSSSMSPTQCQESDAISAMQRFQFNEPNSIRCLRVLMSGCNQKSTKDNGSPRRNQMLHPWWDLVLVYVGPLGAPNVERQFDPNRILLHVLLTSFWDVCRETFRWILLHSCSSCEDAAFDAEPCVLCMCYWSALARMLCDVLWMT